VPIRHECRSFVSDETLSYDDTGCQETSDKIIR